MTRTRRKGVTQSIYPVRVAIKAPIFPCSRCPEGWSTGWLCIPCQVGVDKAADADRKVAAQRALMAS